MVHKMASPLDRNQSVLTLECGHLWSWNADPMPQTIDCIHCDPKPHYDWIVGENVDGPRRRMISVGTVETLRGKTQKRPLELEDIALAAGYCIRERGHDGPCNGLPRNDCFAGHPGRETQP